MLEGEDNSEIVPSESQDQGSAANPEDSEVSESSTTTEHTPYGM